MRRGCDSLLCHHFMYRVEIKPEWLEQAKMESKELGVLRNSITEGEGNLAGYLGEVILSHITEAEIQRTYQYDIVYDGWKIDVKTKRCTSVPQPEYFCSVAAYNTTQECDYYTFVRVLEGFKVAWLLGTIAKADFFKRAMFGKKGQIDPTSTLGWTFKADCYNLPIAELKPFFRKRK